MSINTCPFIMFQIKKRTHNSFESGNEEMLIFLHFVQQFNVDFIFTMSVAAKMAILTIFNFGNFKIITELLLVVPRHISFFDLVMTKGTIGSQLAFLIIENEEAYFIVVVFVRPSLIFGTMIKHALLMVVLFLYMARKNFELVHVEDAAGIVIWRNLRHWQLRT